MRKWYRFNEGGQTPAPTPSEYSLLPQSVSSYDQFTPQQQQGFDTWNQSMLNESADWNQLQPYSKQFAGNMWDQQSVDDLGTEIYWNGEPGQDLLGDYNLAYDPGYRNAYNIDILNQRMNDMGPMPDMSNYVTADQTYGDQGWTMDNIASQVASNQRRGDMLNRSIIDAYSNNLGQISDLRNQIASLPPGYDDTALRSRLSQLENAAPVDTSGIGMNQAAIADLQNQIASLPPGYDDTAIRQQISALQNAPQQDISGIGSNQAAIADLQSQINSLPPGYDDTALRQQISALQNRPQQDISGIAANQQAIQALQNRAPQDISGIGQNAQAIQQLQNAGYLTAADLPAQQDISGIANNAAAIQALQNRPQQDISGIGQNAAAIAALQGRKPQDISGIARNQAAIEALNRRPQQDITGITDNADTIAKMQQQITDLLMARNPGGGNRPGRDGPRNPGGPRRPGGPNTPNTNTGIVDQGAARPYIDAYMSGARKGIDFGAYSGTQGGGSQDYGYTPTPMETVAPPPPAVQPPPSNPTPPPAPTPPEEKTDAETYGEYGSGVSDEAQEIREQYVADDLPFDPFDQGDKAAGTSWGGGVDEVIAAREELPEQYVPPPAPPPGTSQEEAHKVVEESFETFGEAMKDPDLKPEQVAAANPAFNPEVALAAAENPVTIETPAGETYTVPARDLNSVDASAALGSQYSAGVDDFGYIDPFGGTAPANGGTNAIAEAAVEEAKAAGASDAEAKEAGTKAKEKAERKQYEILGNSVLAAGVSNIGGKFNQSGENEGLKDDWLIVGDSKGGKEVWAPDGKTYESVEAAKEAGGSKDKKKEPSVRDKALDRAKQIAKEMSDRGPSRREQNEINARARAAAEAKAKAEAERQAHLDTLDQEGQYQFRADEAINSRDRGDLKRLMMEMGIRYKKDDSSSKLINKLKAGMANRKPAAPPPTAPPPPPPTPQVTPAPAIVNSPNVAPVNVPTVIPPRPREEVTPKREVAPAPLAPAAPTVSPAQEAATAQAKAAISSGSSGALKTAIYAARKAGLNVPSGSLRKKSKSELKRMLAQAGIT